MTDFFQTPRYQLPDDWEVSETMCVKVTIPADAQYFGQLIGLLDSLKWSKNFAPDATRTGAATVSRTWQRALESEPIETEGCDMPELRINPETCLLEVNCSDDPEAPEWKAILTQVTDPRDLEYPTPYPDPPPSGETNQCLSAANIADYVWYAGSHLAERLGDGAIITEVVVAMAGIIATFFQLLTTLIVDETLILFVNITPGTIDDDWLLLDKQDFIDIVGCYVDDDGAMPPARWGDFLDYLLTLGAVNQAWYLVYYVCVLMGVGGFNLAARIAGLTTAECDVCSDWTILQDLTLSDGGWVAESGLATWASGAGWRPSTPSTHMQMHVDFTGSITTLFELFRVEVVNNTGDSRIGYAIEFLDDTDTVIMHQEQIYTTDTFYQWSGSIAGVARARVYLFYFGADPSLIEVNFARFDGTGAEPTI